MKKNSNEYVCFHCNKLILPITEHRMVALDRPYLNLFFHKDCLDIIIKEVDGWDNLLLYISTKIKI